MLLNKFQIFKKPESPFTATRISKKNPAVDFRFGEKIRFEKSIVISLLICIFVFMISPRDMITKVEMGSKGIAVIEYTDVIPSTSQSMQRRPQPERPAIPVEAEVEEMAEDVTIDYQDIGFSDLPGVPGFGGGIGSGKEGFADITIAPRIIRQVLPYISEKDKKKGIKGSVEVSVEVDPNGKVVDVIILRTTLNSQDVLKAVVEASYKCLFVPARRGQRNVQEKYVVKYDIDFAK